MHGTLQCCMMVEVVSHSAASRGKIHQLRLPRARLWLANVATEGTWSKYILLVPPCYG